VGDELTRALTGRAKLLATRGAVYTIQAKRLLGKAARCFAKAEVLRQMEAKAALAEAVNEVRAREAVVHAAETPEGAEHMTVAYAMSDFAAVRLPEHMGGCGEQHHAQVDKNGRRYVECQQCGPALIAGHPGFAGAPADVPLTLDERAARASAEAEGRYTQAGLLSALTEQMRPAGDLASQVAAMSDAERDQLRDLLGKPARKGRA
jgi:hypothetical protein